MELFISIFFWVAIVITLLLIWHEIDSWYADGDTIPIILLIWGVYLGAYFLAPVKETHKTITNYQTTKTEKGLHILYGDESIFTSDIYVIENLGDSTKVKVVETEMYNTRGNSIGTHIEIEKVK